MKTYFGNGKQARGSETIEVTLNVDQLLAAIAEHSFEVRGVRYFKAEVAKRWQVGEHGHTHSVYVRILDRYDRNDRLIDEQESGH